MKIILSRFVVIELKFNKEVENMKIKNKVLYTIINFLPFIFISLGMIAFTVAGFLFNSILGTVLVGITLIVIGLMIIPIKVEGDGN